MTTTKKLQIGVIGYAGAEEYPSAKTPLEDVYQVAERVGFLLAERDVIVVTGGQGGVMESAARGAKQARGLTVGVVNGRQRFRSNQFTDIEILTGMAAAGFDEFLLVTMCDALITIGGGAGTLEEIVIAYRNKKPIIALAGTGGWADKTIEKYLDERETIKVESAQTPEEAVEKAINLVKKTL